MRSKLVALALVLSGCGDLEVDLSDREKDALAAHVEAGGAQEPAPDPVPDIDTEDIETLDHLALGAILGAYVSPEGRVRYAALARDEDAQELLEGYLGLLANVDPAQLRSREERLAFWLNAYNALVLREATRARAQDAGFSTADDDFAFFQARRYTVGGALYSLDQIEHGVIRGDRAHGSVSGLTEAAWAPFAARHAGIFGGEPVDPRIHVGLNCGAASCPALPQAPFTAQNVEALLEERAARFVADPTRGAGPGGISMLFNWFAGDFAAGPQGSARGFVEAYREDSADVNFGAFLEYDWSLNGE
jgi:hypothetical protein